MMKKLKLWGTLVLLLAVVLGGLYGWWALDLRWRPKTIVKHQAEITRILEGSGWVSPGGSGKTLYMVSFRACPDCIRYETEEFPKLHKAGVDTRVIVIARRTGDGGGAVGQQEVEPAAIVARGDAGGLERARHPARRRRHRPHQRGRGRAGGGGEAYAAAQG